MSGISRINKEQTEQKTFSGSSGAFPASRELFLNGDGDQALLAVVAKGDSDEDHRIDSYSRHSYSVPGDDGKERWQYSFCNKSMDKTCALCDQEIGNTQRRFGFWAYVYSIIKKAPGSGEGWEEVTNGAGEKVYKYDINDFKVVNLPFGRNDMFWNQFVGIYHENDGLNDTIIRLSRAGERINTVWTLSVTKQSPDWKKIGDGGKDLPDIKDFFFSVEGDKKQRSEAVDLTDNKVTSSKVAEDLSELF